ncbi:hypothetical protein [Halarcobacter sp.]|uniref:hypothetical protein n=1 Tax=Halarcobacter sp. TaxID=2321133 RepID=UPI002AABE506|nr:hypothetical protein [Halarcobacter sp.]
MSNNINKKILANTKYVEFAQTLYSNNWEINEKIFFLDYLNYFQVSNVTTKFSNNFIEEKLNEISATIDFNLSPTFEKDSILHVMSESYAIGGHTKLLEIFIQNIDGIYKKQSLIITNQKLELSKSLENAIKGKGELTLIPSDLNHIEKAKILANTASNYELIILHIHPNDITSNLAFGNSKFKRPIIFLNHTDHMYWCGVSIADLTLDLTAEGNYFSKEVRDINNSHIVNIPIIDKELKLTREEARKYLKIEKNKKIILTIATEYKYGRTREEIFKFANMADNITKNIENSEFLLIGPSKNNPSWNEIYEKSKGRVNPLGLKERHLLEYYILAADLYIESFPFASYTAFLDTSLYGIKMMSLNTPIFSLDIIKENNLSADSIEKLEKKAIDFLKNKNDEESYKIDLSRHMKDDWNKNLIEIITNHLPSTGTIHRFKSKDANTKYLNHILKVVGTNPVLIDYLKKLPTKIQLKLEDKLLSYKILVNHEQSCKNIFDFKCFRKKSRDLRYRIKNKIKQIFH